MGLELTRLRGHGDLPERVNSTCHIHNPAVVNANPLFLKDVEEQRHIVNQRFAMVRVEHERSKQRTRKRRR